MEDPLIYRDVEQVTCPECDALFEDDVALGAHREQEHVEEVEGGERRRGVLEHGDDEDAPNDGDRDSPRPTEPAP
jgi:hypothetical protein